MDADYGARYDASRKAGLAEPHVDREGDAKSRKAEHIVHQYLGCEMVATDDEKPDKGYDLIHKGFRIDVKHTPTKGQYLLVKHPDHIRNHFDRLMADIYVLVVGDKPVGYAWQDAVLLQPVTEFSGYKGEWVYTWDREKRSLLSIEALRDM